ncbi:MAG TPA: hypothetical protein VNA28_08610 [Solirubrobacteraceae bacterium]|nr:hypothetical protein [Solirubrobacteraceae bacterium]
MQMPNLSARVTAARTSFCTPVGNGKRNPKEFVLVVDCKGDNAPCRRWDPFLDGDRDTIVTKACQAYAHVRPFGRRTVGVDPVQIITPANRADPSRPGKFKVWWRVVTRDGRWVMVHDAMGRRSGGAIWVFVAAGCVLSPHAPMSS